MTFEEIMNLAPANRKNFEALVEAVRGGRAVPFVGAGLSWPYYPLWRDALDKLKAQVAPDRLPAAEAEFQAAKTEIERCGVLETALGGPALCRALCELFDLRKFTEAKDSGYSGRPAALLPWLFPEAPLLTTNLERMLVEVYWRCCVPFDRVLSLTDQSILTKLQEKRAHGILYLHGCIFKDLTDYDSLIFSRSQYERGYAPDGELVKVLQKWMEGAQLLFLGCSLRNDRTLDILRKVCAAQGRLEHFAILDLKEEDADLTARMNQLEEDYGIRAILYPEKRHEAVRAVLGRLLWETDPESWRTWHGTLPAEPVTINAEDAKRFTPEAQSTALCGRDEERWKLMYFCRDSREFAWWAVTGPGGSGKTRLMQELAEYVKKLNWSVKVLNFSEYTEDALKSLLDCRQNLLVISDYAGEHAETLAVWIGRMSNHRGAKLRLLLAEREAGPDAWSGKPISEQLRNSWYERMKSTGIDPQILLETQYGESENFLALKPLNESALKELMQSYAKIVYDGHKLTKKETEMLYQALEKTDPGLCRPLYAMFLADAFLHTGDPREWDRETVLRELTEREQRHLEARQRAFLGLEREDAPLTDAVRKLRLQATVCGGATLSALPAWKEIRQILESRYYRRPIEFLRSLELTDAENETPEETVAVAPVKPDLFGEFFILRHLREALSQLFASDWLRDVGRRAFLGRLIQDYGNTLPEPVWDKLFSSVPRTAAEAEGLMGLLWIVTYRTDLHLCWRATAKMEKVYSAFPVRFAAYIFAVGLFNLSCDQELVCKNDTVDRLHCLCEAYPDDREIALEYAKVLYNLSCDQKLTERIATLDRLDSLCKAFQEDQNIALQYAKGLFNLSTAHASKKDRAVCKNALERLGFLCEAFQGDREIALRYAKGLFNQSCDQSPTDRNDTVEQLRRLSKDYRNDMVIQRVYQKGLYISDAHPYKRDPIHGKEDMHMQYITLNDYDIFHEVEGFFDTEWYFLDQFSNMFFSMDEDREALIIPEKRFEEERKN